MATDATTVVVTLKQADPAILPAMASSLGAVFLPADIANPDKDKSAVPIGSGPYVLDDANTTPGSVYTYVRNADYWDTAAYPFDKLILRPMADVAARMNALKAGEVDGAVVPASNAADIEANGLTLNTGISNWAGLHLLDRDGTLVPALANVKVRQAINMAFDREAIVKNDFEPQSLADPLERCGHFPALLVQIVNIGERSGRLEPMLMHAAGAFDRQVSNSIKIFTKSLPPVLLVVMACVAAFVLVAILLPLLEMQSAIGG